MAEQQLIDDIAHGEQLFATGRLLEALEHFETLLEHEPENFRVFNDKGVVLNRMGRYHEATIAFFEALQRDRTYTTAVFNLISNYIDMYAFKEAVQALHEFGECLAPGDIAEIRQLSRQLRAAAARATTWFTHLNIAMDVNGIPHTLQLQVDRKKTTQGRIYDCFSNSQLYEPGMSRLFAEVLQEGDCVVDVGAHIGYFTVLAASLVGVNGKVLACEIEEENYQQLQANIALNDFSHVFTWQGALGADNTPTQFFVNSDDDGGHALWNISSHFAHVRSHRQCQTRRTEMMTLDAILQQHAVEAIKLIKISAAGAEYDVILGSIQTLITYDVPYIVCRLHPFALQQMGHTESDLRSFMGSIGYEARVITADGLTLQRLAPAAFLDEQSVTTVVFSKLPQIDTLPYPQIF
jgi:FkbM family methyltransferase